MEIEYRRKSLRILYITNYDTMYGANKSLFMLMTILKKQYGVEPYLLVPGGGMIGSLCEQEGIHVLKYDFRISALSKNTKCMNTRFYTRRIMRYKDFYSIYKSINQMNLKFDIVHSNSSIFDLGLFLSKKWNIPHVWHIREFAKEGCGLYSIFSQQEIRKQYLESKRIIAISGAIYDSVKKIDSNIQVSKIYNGVALRTSYKKYYATDHLNICIIGCISRLKNQMDVVKACENLLQKGYYNLSLFIVGGIGGEYYREIFNYVNTHESLINHVVFTGYCEDVNSFLTDKDIGITATDVEAFGRVTIEYMSNYMPVIGTNTGGTPEIVANRELLFQPHDITKLSLLIEQFLINPELLVSEGLIARNKAELFSAEQNAKEIFDVYNEVIKEEQL